MGVHEQAIGATDEWYTPERVFVAMGATFDFDPCGGPDNCPATRYCRTVNRERDGLRSGWHGFVWLNPPFGGRNALGPWLYKFARHGNGVVLTPDRTSAPWWQAFAQRADAALFVAPKLRFIGADGREGRSPAQGTTLMAIGAQGVTALRRAEVAGLGLLMGRI